MRTQTQRLLLHGFLGSISMCGLIGVVCLLLGTWGSFQARVLGTTAVMAAASVLGLCSAMPRERRIWQPVGSLGLAAVTTALVGALLAIWTPAHQSDAFMRMLAIACIYAVGLPHLGLLALARLHQHLCWVRKATVMVLSALAVQLTLTILFEPNADLWMRMIGVLSILAVCGTITVPILHRISAIPREGEERAVGDRLILICPRCSKQLEQPLGHSTCGGCGLGFQIEIEAEVSENEPESPPDPAPSG